MNFKSKWSSIKVTLSWLSLLIASTVAMATEDDIEPPAPVANANNGFMIEESNFDQWIFQGSGTAAAGRARINSHLKLKLDELNRTCDLSDLQRKKLALAAQGDMKRFFDQVEALRKKFLEVRKDQNAFNALWQEIHPLQQKQQAGLFNETSMFEKTLRSTLNEEQQQRYQKITEERRHFRYRASIQTSLVSLSDTVALKDDQHKAIAKLLLEETALPLRFGQQDQQVVFYGLSKLPSAKLKAILNDRQWKLMQPQLNQGQAMEQFLAQNGFIDAPKGGGAKGIRNQINMAIGVLRIEAAAAAEVIDVQVIEVQAQALPALEADVPADALKPERRTTERN
ncbi:MAG TPA: hypothetical protein VGM98_20135 [Schlesneria sp.]|jgi:hypothetical protein